MKFPIRDFLSDQIDSFLRIWSHLLKKSLLETSFFVQQALLRFEQSIEFWSQKQNKKEKHSARAYNYRSVYNSKLVHAAGVKFLPRKTSLCNFFIMSNFLN